MRIALRFVPTLAGALALLAGGAAFAAKPPNIVVILADDLGARDLAADGARLAETPALDRLRAQGLAFSAAYAPAPICSASRAALLTGRSPARLHFEFVTKAANAKPPPDTRLIQPAFPIDLPLEEVTIAEVLAPAGYATGFFGKWHLTQANDRYLGHGSTFGPRQQGFAETDEERGSHPYNYPKGRRPPAGDFAPGDYEPDALTERAIRFLREQREGPFLLFLSLYHVHDPVQTRCAWLLEKYRDKAARLGVEASDAQIRYAAFVDIMDHLAGRVLGAMDELGLGENTVVIFTSDNGGAPHFTDNGALRGSKWTLYEGGIRVPMIVRWPGVTPPGATCATPVIGTDVLPTLAEIAGASVPANRPLDGVSLRGLLADPGATLSRESLQWHFPFYHPDFVNETPVSALRRGTLKLVYHYEGPRVELFDLARDPGETTDLSALRPEDAQRLRAELLWELRAVGARFPRERGGE